MSQVAASVTAIGPPYNPEPHLCDVASMQAADAAVALWRQGWQAAPVVLKYVFDPGVTLTGYVAAPPPDDPFQRPNGWEVRAYRHGASRDA